MAKKNNPFEEGHLKTIYEWFIAPLVFYKPTDTPLKTWLEQLFHIDTREITQYRAIRHFRMPGLFWRAPHLKTQGIGYRSVYAGTELMVRKDNTEKTYDIEFFGGIGEQSQVFTLSESEFNSIAPDLKHIENNIKRKRRSRVKSK